MTGSFRQKETDRISYEATSSKPQSRLGKAENERIAREAQYAEQQSLNKEYREAVKYYHKKHEADKDSVKNLVKESKDISMHIKQIFRDTKKCIQTMRDQDIPYKHTRTAFNTLKTGYEAMIRRSRDQYNGIESDDEDDENIEISNKNIRVLKELTPNTREQLNKYKESLRESVDFRSECFNERKQLLKERIEAQNGFLQSITNLHTDTIRACFPEYTSEEISYILETQQST